MPKLSESTEFGKSQEEILLKAVAFDGLKQKEKSIKKEIDALGNELREALKTSGVTDPNTNNVYIHGFFSGKKVDIVNTSRKSTSFVPEVQEILDNELTEEDFNDLFQPILVLREDLLEQKVLEGKISAELLDRITNIKEIFALTVKVK